VNRNCSLDSDRMRCGTYQPSVKSFQASPTAAAALLKNSPIAFTTSVTPFRIVVPTTSNPARTTFPTPITSSRVHSPSENVVMRLLASSLNDCTASACRVSARLPSPNKATNPSAIDSPNSIIPPTNFCPCCWFTC